MLDGATVGNLESIVFPANVLSGHRKRKLAMAKKTAVQQLQSLRSFGSFQFNPEYELRSSTTNPNVKRWVRLASEGWQKQRNHIIQKVNKRGNVRIHTAEKRFGFLPMTKTVTPDEQLDAIAPFLHPGEDTALHPEHYLSQHHDALHENARKYGVDPHDLARAAANVAFHHTKLTDDHNEAGKNSLDEVLGHLESLKKTGKLSDGTEIQHSIDKTGFVF